MSLLVDLLLVAGASFRRQLAPSALLVALLAGAALGLLQRALPDAFTGADAGWMMGAAGLLLVVLLAGGRRHPARLAATPLRSLAWSGGELFGGAVAAGVLLALLLVAGRLALTGASEPLTRPGLAQSGEHDWRFEIPAGSDGPFLLEFQAQLPLTASGALRWSVERGGARAEGSARLTQPGPLLLELPDLAPARGNLYLHLRPDAGVVLEPGPPLLRLGARAPRAFASPLLAPDARARLLLACLVALAARCAFTRGTATVAGGLGLVVDRPGEPALFALALLLLVAFAWAATSLRRRTLLA